MKWSLSKLGTFERCPAKYDFKYNKRMKEKQGEAAARGSGKHDIVDGFFKQTIPELPPDLDFYSSFFIGLRDAGARAEHRICLREDLSVCEWEDPLGWFQCILDLQLVSSPTVAVVYDWKTGKIYEDHDDQKELYSLATFAEHPDVQEVSAFHVYLDSNQTRKKTYSRSQVPEMWEKWKGRLSALELAHAAEAQPTDERFKEWMKGTNFPPNPGFLCRWCGFSKSQGGPCRF